MIVSNYFNLLYFKQNTVIYFIYYYIYSKKSYFSILFIVVRQFILIQTK